MTDSDNEQLGRLLDALLPYLDRLVLAGGWAHRLYRDHRLAQPVPYPPLMTRDADVAVPIRMRIDEGVLRRRLIARGFSERFLGDDRPPVTHYQLGTDDAGFYAEFLTPLVGSEIRRDGTRDVTTIVGGVSVQKLRYVEILLIAPWTVTPEVSGRAISVRVANPVSYIVQKLLISERRDATDRAKDMLSIHDTIELFGASLPALRALWVESVRRELKRRTRAQILTAAARAFAAPTDIARAASTMAVGRALSARRIVDSCQAGLAEILV
jgi:hypothetical protein